MNRLMSASCSKPYASSLAIRRSWGMQSQTLEGSSNTAQLFCFCPAAYTILPSNELEYVNCSIVFYKLLWKFVEIH